MPENDFLRRKRERDFQDRVLAAVEKPKRNRFLAVMNSAFFLWLMSVFVLTLGGGYLTGHKQCLDDAQKIIDRRRHLKDELSSRDLNYQRRVDDAKTVQEVITFPDKRGSIYSDLANLTYSEVQAEYFVLDSRIRYIDLADPVIDKYRRDSREFTTAHSEKLHRKLQTPLDDDKTVQKPTDTARTIKSQQLNAELYVARMSFEYDLESYAYFLQPDCSALKLGVIALGYRPPIVSATVNPYFNGIPGSKNVDDESFASLAHDKIKEIEKTQQDLISFEAEEESR